MNSSANNCARCNKPIFAADKQEKYEGKVYHSSCFTCSSEGCRIKLTTQNVKRFNKMPFCQSHVPNDPFNRRTTYSDHTYENVPSLTSDQTMEGNRSSSDYDEIEEKKTDPPQDLKKEIRTIIRRSGDEMVNDVFTNISRDLHVVVCGSPRVGKSTLINALCGKEVAVAREGMNSVTQKIECYTTEGQCNTGTNVINYKYNFWDTPGFESWEKDNIKPKMKEIVEKPDSKPLCMIFCASPGTFVNVNQLEWLLHKCINRWHIFCALVCTNKHAGTKKSRQAVLDEYNRLLSKFVTEPPRVENEITFYGNVALCAAVNSTTFEDDDRELPASGVNELIYGIMQSLVDEQVLSWCLLVLENNGFWNDCQQKVSTLVDKVKGTKNILKQFLSGKKKKEENFKSFVSNK